MAAIKFLDNHLLGIRGLDKAAIEHVLKRAELHAKCNRSNDRKQSSLKGATVINLFYEGSTRTRTSFELAGKRLGADVVNVSIEHSSVKKGESLLDTAMTLAAMHPDFIVIRHQHSGAPHFLAERLPCGIINAGDGCHEHPTQALLDAFTISRRKGRIKGLKIAICGDIMHSRVARSNALLLTEMGADVHFIAPPTLMPPAVASNEALARQLLSKKFEIVEINVLMPLHIWLQNNGYCPHFKQPEKPSDKPDSS
jgi:aspartate carbamoyltransferase catalytic subunit